MQITRNFGSNMTPGKCPVGLVHRAAVNAEMAVCITTLLVA
jgi:hypothetical protein